MTGRIKGKKVKRKSDTFGVIPDLIGDPVMYKVHLFQNSKQGR